VFGLWLVGCGAQDLESDDLASQIEQDFGGPSGLMEFFATHSQDEIRQAMDPYGVRFTTQLITDCPQYFPSSDRNIWHNINGEYYFIEGSGRPSRAYAYLPPITAAARNDTCQASVGQWGDAANPSNEPGAAGCELQPRELGDAREQDGQVRSAAQRPDALLHRCELPE
jgi:hypothetical protein